MKKHIICVFTLFLICAIVAVALAVCYEITAPIILERQQAAASGALAEVMPDGGTFEKVDISTYTLPATVKEAHKASNGGYPFPGCFCLASGVGGYRSVGEIYPFNGGFRSHRVPLNG